MRVKKRTQIKSLFFMLMFLVTMLIAGCGKGQNQDAVQPTTVPATEPTMVPTPALTVGEQFDVFTDELFKSEIMLNTINLHYTLAYPENFGITDYEPTLGSFDLEEMEASYVYMEELKAELEKFTYEELSKEQQFTYDVILDYINTELSVKDLLLYTEVLGPVTGYQAQLPVLLAEYKFRTVQDIEDYLALLALVDDLFAELVAFENAKAEAGLFMADFAAEAIVDQCRQFIEHPEDNYMLDVFETEINAFEGLSDVEKQNYIERNHKLVTTDIVAAYQILIDGLEALKGSGTNDKGLCYYEDGARYYEYLVRSLTGSAQTPEELLEATGDFIDSCIFKMQTVMFSNPNAMDGWETYEFCETEPDKILEDLIVKIKEDFPELPEVNYTIKYVHPSMEEHMSPAFYLTPPVDDMNNNVIYINESQLDLIDLYTTMAHEGYPGHLYQNVYTGSKNLPLVRNLFSSSGYSEGWATYVEYYAYGIGGLDEDLAKILQLNNAATLGIYAAVDLGVHYKGWDVSEVEQFLSAYGLGTPEIAQEIFEIIVEEPVNYLSYFVGYMEFLNLRDTAETAWGENYSLKKFHEVVLSLGPAPFDLLNECILNYDK